jgi:hypothetical protein
LTVIFFEYDLLVTEIFNTQRPLPIAVTVLLPDTVHTFFDAAATVTTTRAPETLGMP